MRNIKMVTSKRSPKLLKFENKLYEANQLLAEIRDLWFELNEAEHDTAGTCYPSYLPSFDEFVMDIEFWVQHLANRDNQA